MKTERQTSMGNESEKSQAPKKTRRSAAKSSTKANGKTPVISYEHAPIGIVECTPDGNHINANEEFCRLLGYEKKELIGKSLKDITHEDDYPIDIRLHQQLVEGKIPFYRLEKRYLDKNGNSIWTELTRSIVRDASGNPLHTIGVVLDISDRKHVERVLRDSTERLRLATEVARMFTWELDLKTQTYTFADNFEKVLGFSAGLLPKNSVNTVQSLSPLEDVQVIEQAFTNAIDHHDDLHALQYRMIDPASGQIVWLEANAKIVYDQARNPQRMFGVTQNITERKQAEEQLRQQTEILEWAYVLIRDMDSRIISWNKGVEQLYGWTKEEALGKVSHELFQTKFPVSFEDTQKTLLKNGEWEGELEHVKRDGTRLVVLSHQVIHRDAAGNPVAILEDNSDITQRKRIERQQAALYQLTDRLQRINSLEDMFDAALDAILEALQCDRASILLFDEQDVMSFVAWRDLSDAYRKTTNGHSPWKPDAINPVPICMNDVDTADLSESLRATIKEEGIGALAFIPLVSNGQLIGKFMTYYNSPHVFEEAETDLSLTIARQFAFGLDRHRAEEALRASEEKYRRIVETANEGIWEIDGDTNTTFVNARMAEMLGYRVDEMLGRSSFEFTFSEDQLIGQDRLALAKSGDPTQSREFRFQRKDGTALWALVSSSPQLDERGNFLGSIAMIVDITERRQIEQQLVRERELLNRLFETMPVMVSMYDPKTNSLRLNAEFERRLGWKTEELTIASMLDAIYPDPDYRAQVVKRMSEAGQNEWVEVQVRSRDGQTLDSMWANISILNDRYIGIGVDITERKRSEEALRQAALFDETVMSNMGEGLYTVDRDGKVTSMNPAAEKMFGWTVDELRGRRMHDMTHYKHPDGTPFPAEECAGFQVLHHGDKLVGHEDIFIRKDGTFFDVIYSSSPLWQDGKITGLVVVFSDNTTRKQAEKRLTLLSEISELVRKLEDPSELMLAVSTAVGEYLDVRRCLFNEIDLENDLEIVHRDYVNGVQSVAGVHKISDYSGVTSVEMASGKTVVNRDSKIDPRTAPDYERSYVEYGERAYVTVPLMRENHWVASLWVSDDKPRAWSEEDVSLLETIAERAWIAVEKLKINRKLYDSEERLRVTFETAVVGFSTLDLDTRFLEVNDAFCHIVGYSREELLQMDWSVLTHPAYLEGTYHEVAQLIENNVSSFELEKIYIRKDGKQIWVQDSVSLVRDVNDKPLHLIAICQDISERKNAESALQASEQRFREIFETAGVSVWLEDFTDVKKAIDGLRAQGVEDFRAYFVSHPDFVQQAIDSVRILDVNNETLTLFRATDKEDLLGSLSNVFAPETAHIFVEELMALAEGRETVRAETEVRSLDGHAISVLFTVHFAAPNADHSHVVVTLTDITERKRAEEALRIENERFSRFVDSNIVGVIIADPTGKILLANDYYLRLLGVTRQDFLDGKVDWMKFTPPEWLHADEKAIRELRETGVCEPYEKEYVRADGTRVPVYLADAMLPGPGEEIAAFVLDLTERKQAEESLRASEELYRTIARSIPGGGVYVVDKDMRYIVADGAVTESFGLSRESLEGHTVSEVFQGDQRARMIERLTRNFAGETVSYETEHKGRVYWTQQAPLEESIGEAIIVTLDITERKQMEQALRQSEELFAQFMEHLPGLAWIKNLEGRYVYANVAAEKAFGTRREILYGKTDPEIFLPDIAIQFGQNDQLVQQEEKGIQVVETLPQEDGILHYSLVTKFPIPGPDGNVALIGGTAFDITDRKMAEEALRESEERYHNLFDLVPIALYTCDANGLIQEYNHSAVELWGREPARKDPSEKYSGAWKMYFADGRPMPHEICPMARMLRGEKLELGEREILIERPDGTRRSVLAHPFPIRNPRGEIIEAINCLYDITERKQAEEALQSLNLQLETRVVMRTAELQEANLALQESRKRLQILSQRLVEVQEEERRAIARELHDRVGQTLSALNINMIIMRDQLSADSLERVGSRLNDSMHLVGETITLVRDVMSNLRPAVLDDYGLEAALQSHVDEYKSRYGIDVRLEKPAQPLPRLVPSIEMTFLRIAQEALMNIARHAKASRVDLSLWKDGDSVCMTIQDNGTGIVSWEQANRPGSHGLTIMRERAEAFGGNLQLSSAPGKGTKIEMSIPIGKDDPNNVQKEVIQ